MCTLPTGVRWLLLAVCIRMTAPPQAADAAGPLRLAWKDRMLTISGDHLPGESVKVWYIEAYCRPGSTDRDWSETTIGHTTELVSASSDQRRLVLKCTLNDGVVVTHRIEAHDDSVEFNLVAANPTRRESSAHWAQPCIRVDRFTGRTQETYLPKSFVFYEDRLTRMPTQHWATRARYEPGQVWCPIHVNRDDVNPRPLSEIVPSNGLIGCFSADERMILATAWEPYQELFQGVIVCLHSDFRIGGLKPGESKRIRGKIYLTAAAVPALLKRYAADFPEHQLPRPSGD